MQLNILQSEFFEYVSSKCKMRSSIKKNSNFDRFNIDCVAEILFPIEWLMLQKVNEWTGYRMTLFERILPFTTG